MKRLLIAFILLCSSYGYSQIINFPDANFKARLIALGVDTNTDGEIQQSEALVPTALDLSNQNIADATGIEFFTSLTTLRFNGNNLTSIDVSSNTALRLLAVTANPITTLNVFDNTALESLFFADCTNLSSVTLPSSGSNLISISGRDNTLLTSINLTPYTNLIAFSLTGGGLTSLDVSSNTALTALVCTSNALTSLDVSSNAALQVLQCGDNNLTNLSFAVNSNLQNLACGGNALTSLDISSLSLLSSLDCMDNDLFSLNIKNGNNSNFNAMFASNNPNLVCIQVDDAAAAAANTNFTKDAFTTYSDTNPCSPFINFPDANMKAAVIINPGIDINGDGEVQFNEAARVTSLGLLNANISDATGIENFTSLRNLTIKDNPALNTLDVSALSLLEVLDASNNSLTSSNLILPSSSTLRVLNVSDNSLTSLDVSGFTNLEDLDCTNNTITSLNITSSSIIDVFANANPLTSFDVPATNTLTRLYLGGFRLTSLDTSLYTGLQELDLDFSRVTSLDVSSNTNLTYLSVGNGNLAELNLSNLTNSTTINTSGNTNLSCIIVSDVAVANANTNWTKDATANYALSCGPSIAINNAPASTSGPFTVTFNIDRDVTGFTASDVVLTNASISGFTAISGPDEYEALITPVSICGTNITIDVPANVMIDGSNAPNSAATQVTIATVDDVDPIALSQDITVQLGGRGNDIAIITGADIDNGSTDNCGIANVTVDKTTFNCTEIGTNTVILTVTDTSGNINTTTAIVTVEDDNDPIAIAQDITIQLGANGQATITAQDINNGSSDNCSVALSLSQSTFDCSNLGANTVTLTATDPSGNTDTATAIVTIEDNQPLTAVAQNITVQLDANGQATIAPQDVDNGSGSGCGNITLSLDTTNFDCSNIGQNTVTLTVTEGPNTETATAIVTVEDSLNPTVVTQDIAIQLDTNGQASITAADIDNGSSDNCGIATQTLDITSFDCSNIGANTVTLTVTDTEGNVGAATAIVTVSETVAPTALAQDITVQLDGMGNASITAAQIDNGSTDNCSVTNRSLDTTTFSCTDLGANTVTLTVEDASGNTDTATATVTVEDNSTPTAIAQNITVQLDTNGQVTIQGSDLDNGSTDNCTLTFTVDTSTFDCSALGANTVTLTATDDSGNSSIATATVTVEDTLAPTVTTQDITVTLDANGDGSIAPSDINNGSTDNCTADADLIYALDTTTFDCSNLGANTVTLTVADAEGNTSTGTATVTVTEDVAPTVVTQDITVSLDTNGQASITAADIDNGSTDDCSGIASTSLDITDFDCPGLGDVTVTLTVTDNEGNTATGTATVTITATDEDNNGVADDCESKEIVTPQGFSPNGDTINDTWVIENIDDFPNSKVTVYNRWGQKVFEANNYQNDWDGTSTEAGSGNRLPAGSYLYVIELNDPDFPPKQGWIYINY
ncbi:gliding motility-associated C-terminal domain-containing protein [Spongiivirga citrea]|uniref:T9SS type B sorting domain-containing protein n=1 Tax=Spongiivirga citrea TaxID=1481457 RepID=A0A6M0CKE6_9FLAO|nr:gliding motility-associated C-terminal domain-containing protein [Spongiivirga citrea]NER18331.1 T9SS type B sorting domain-containing protein [Spongiivirga citrea]